MLGLDRDVVLAPPGGDMLCPSQKVIRNCGAGQVYGAEGVRASRGLPRFRWVWVRRWEAL